MDIPLVIRDFERLYDAVKNFRDTVSVCGTFGGDALPEHMGCGEANAFSELLDALGIPEEASAVRHWHLEADHPDWPDEKNETSHGDWPED